MWHYIEQTLLELQQLVFGSLVVFVVGAEFIHVQHVNERRLLPHRQRSHVSFALQFKTVSLSNQSVSYHLEQLEATNQRPDLAPAQEDLPQDGEIMEVPHVMGGALIDVGGGLLSDIIIHRRQDPHAEALEQLRALSIKSHASQTSAGAHLSEFIAGYEPGDRPPARTEEDSADGRLRTAGTSRDWASPGSAAAPGTALWGVRSSRLGEERSTRAPEPPLSGGSLSDEGLGTPGKCGTAEPD